MTPLQTATQKADHGEELNALEVRAICQQIITLIDRLDAIHSADMDAFYARQPKAA